MGASAVSPDDFVAGTTYWGPPTVFRCLLSCLQNGAAVLHWRWLDWLLVLGHNSAGLVWAKTVGEIRISDPWWSNRRSWAACCCSCSLGAWARETEMVCLGNYSTYKNFADWIISQRRGGHFYVMYTLVWDVCCDSLYVSRCCSWCSCIDTYKNLLAQPLLDAAGFFFFFTLQQEQKLTIWFICCLGLGRWGSWLKAVGRKWLIRKSTHTHTSVTMVTTIQRMSCLDISSQDCFH